MIVNSLSATRVPWRSSPPHMRHARMTPCESSREEESLLASSTPAFGSSTTFVKSMPRAVSSDFAKSTACSRYSLALIVTISNSSSSGSCEIFFLSSRDSSTALHRQDFLFLLLRDFFEFVNVIVGEFLDLGETVFLVVLGNAFVLEHLFQMLVPVAADVADGRAMFFENLIDVLRELL